MLCSSKGGTAGEIKMLWEYFLPVLAGLLVCFVKSGIFFCRILFADKAFAREIF